jgi:hypothetical protein
MIKITSFFGLLRSHEVIHGPNGKAKKPPEKPMT